MAGTHLPGLQLSEAFYWEVVRPILDAHFPGIEHAAALIGSGSEVLGFDDAMSADHHYGPRVLLFLRDEAHALYSERIHAVLAEQLPYSFRGYSTNFSEPDPDDHGVQHLQPIGSGLVNHRVELYTVRGFFADYLGIDPGAELTPADWLTAPQQKLRTVVDGALYYDSIGLEEARRRLTWYPHDLWLYLLASGWARIGQEEHLTGRAGMAGDEVGAALIAGRLVRDVMRLCFLLERTYAPYPKWFGTAFRQLRCGPELLPVLESVLHGASWEARETSLVVAYERLAWMHNQLALTRPMPEEVRAFFGRPYRVIALHGFADELLRAIRDPEVQAIAQQPPIGNVDLFSDNTDLLSNLSRQSVLRQLYR